MCRYMNETPIPGENSMRLKKKDFILIPARLYLLNLKIYKNFLNWLVNRSRNFLTPEATQIFDRFATYNGSDPFRAPAMLSMIPHLEHNQGTYYPRGGMISITNALFHLAKAKGVQFYFDSPVQRIIHHENRVEGVVIKDTNVP